MNQMKVTQTISGDDELIDFAVSSDGKVADIYTMHVSSLTKKDLHAKINEYVTLTDPNVGVKTLKEENGKDKVNETLFNIVSAFLKGSKRGRSDSVFDKDERGSKKLKGETQDDIPLIVVDIDLTNTEEYGNLTTLMNAIRENIERRKIQAEEWGKKWENLTEEEINELDRKYEEEIKREEEFERLNDPDYVPGISEEYEDDSEDDSEDEFDSEDEDDSEDDSENDSDTLTDDSQEESNEMSELQELADEFNKYKERLEKNKNDNKNDDDDDDKDKK